MQVKCYRIYNENTGQYQDISSWLTVGKTYTVLEVEVYPGKDVLFRLVGDNTDKGPALYDSRQFEVESNKLSSNWVINRLSDGSFTLGPSQWQKPGFWEECYDREPGALAIYKREAEAIYAE